MRKPAWVAIGIGVGLAAGIGGYAAFSGRSAEAGPYGGDVVSIDKGAGYAELVANRDTGEVMVHTWDKDLTTARPVEAKPMTLGTAAGSIPLAPHPLSTDPSGYCSRFYGQADWMRGGDHHTGWLRMGDDAAARQDFQWKRCWEAGRSHGGMWDEMGEHRRMGPGMRFGEGRRVPAPSEHGDRLPAER